MLVASVSFVAECSGETVINSGRTKKKQWGGRRTTHEETSMPCILSWATTTVGGGNPPPPVIRALIMKFCLNLPVKVAVKLSVETVLAWFTESKNS